ncbi:uncharacterized protein LOC144350259 [Saccoglossus kowalevskii]
MIYSKDFQTHLKHISQVLETLGKAGLKLRPEKCLFARRQIEYLGHTLNSKGISPSPTKNSAISDFPIPKTVHEVRRFLGMAGYYRRSILNVSTIASPLHELTKSHTRFVWDEKCETAFNTLKGKLSSSPVLAYPKSDIPFEIYADVSDIGVGFTLEQQQEGVQRIIMCGGHKLSQSQSRWTIAEKELYSLYYAIKTTDWSLFQSIH